MRSEDEIKIRLSTILKTEMEEQVKIGKIFALFKEKNNMRSEDEIREYIRVLDDTRKRLVKKGKEAYTTVHDAEINALEWVLEEQEK